MSYTDYDVPSDLIFKTADIVRMKGLQCSAKLAPKNFENILSEPNKILKVSLKLNFSVGQKEILVTGEIDGAARLRCGRCLEFFDAPFHEEFELAPPIKAEIIDIMYEATTALALTENIAPVCKETCKGLCAVCGKNKNEQNCGCKEEAFSPFAALKNLK
ncbi:MAG: DUF177 domain-containing protein [Elusimicrobium sp.]|jgi:uncharacterized protein|nr:DUF177 domain-containing protein [Elusimicrobium sp.]